MSVPVYSYFNNAATSYPKPDAVLEAVVDMAYRIPFDAGRTGFDSGREDCLTECRKNLALLFNGDNPDRIIFTSGATESINLAIKGLDGRDGMHVVTTAAEHNSVLRPLFTLEREGRVRCTIVPCNEYGLVAPHAIGDAITPATAAVVITHCSNVTGMVNDLQAIGTITREKRIILIVDASQSAGVYPIDLREMPVDILVFTGHKSLLGMQGTGGVFIREGLTLTPLKVGGTGVRSEYLYQPEMVPMFYEAGTPNVPGIASLNAGVKYLLGQDRAALRTRREYLAGEVKRRIERYAAVCTYPGPACPLPTTLFSFTIEGIDPEDVGYMLENSFGIITRSGLHCAPLIHRYLGTHPRGSTRVSPSIFTTDTECDRLVDAIGAIAGRGGAE